MILSTPEELRIYLPTHVIDDIDNVRGAIDMSEHDFLRERIGAPLLKALQDYYSATFLDADGQPDYAAIGVLIASVNRKPWDELVALCQRCVVFDAFARIAQIQTVSVNNAGINVVDTKGYDNAPDKTVAAYKAQLQRESHAAVNRLLIQLEDWQKEVAANPMPIDLEEEPTEEEPSEENPTEEEPTEEEPTAEEEPAIKSLVEIISLWKQSAYYYQVDGLLFNTASEFNEFCDIYDSREKFIQIVPDIRYCQETHLAEELGDDFLLYLIEMRKAGTLSNIETTLVRKLQRTLSLMVVARNPMFKRPEAKDEASGHMKRTLRFIREHRDSWNASAFATSPLNTHSFAGQNGSHSKHHASHPGDMLVTSII